MNRHRWGALAALVTITLAACSSGGGAREKTSAGGQVGPGRVVASATAAKTMEELEEKLDISVPDGWRRTPDPVAETGPSDLEKAVRDDGAPDARDVLTRTRFVRGYQRMWTAAGADDEIVAYVYQFADSAGALDYTSHLNAGLVTPSEGVTVTPFDVPEIEAAVGVNIAEPGFSSSSVTFVKGPYSVQMVVNGSSPAVLEVLAAALAEEQYSRL